MSNNKQAQLINGHWVVETNKWNANIYTKEQAEKYADTLINCTNCVNCSSCHDCRYCHNCSDCHNCSYFKENPERITSPKIGSIHGNTTYYWTKDHEQIECGWFKGTLEDFEKAIEEKHGNNQRGVDYKNWIQKVKLYKGL